MASRVLIFANPLSGRGRARAIAERVQRRLRAEHFEVGSIVGAVHRFGYEDWPADASAAIVIGGDGTLRTVAESLIPPEMSEPGAAIRSVPLLVVPLGTANLMGKHLGTRWDDELGEQRIIDALAKRHVVELDAAIANGQLMLIVAGVGLDAAAVHELAARRRGPISYLSYAWPTFAAVASYGFPPISVRVDGQTLLDRKPAIAFIGNLPEYGTGFSFVPLATPTDGLLDLCVLPCASMQELTPHLLRAAAGEHLHGEGVLYARGKSIRVDSPAMVPVQIDGEAAGHTPLAIDLLSKRLPFIVP